MRENVDIFLFIGDCYLEINQKNFAKKYYSMAQEYWEKIKSFYENSEEYSSILENKVRIASSKTVLEEEQERNESLLALLSKYQLNPTDKSIVDEVISLDQEFTRRLCKEYRESGTTAQPRKR